MLNINSNQYDAPDLPYLSGTICDAKTANHSQYVFIDLFY